MEELLCIGCGAKIQIEDKEKVGYTPKAALEKRFREWRIVLPKMF